MTNLTTNQTSTQEETKRSFKGIWIPKEIWLDDDLIMTDKVLLAEIDSLDDGELGCHASNKYLAQFLKMTVWGIQKSLQRLKAKNLIKIVNQNERRYIQSSLTKREGGGCTPVHGGDVPQYTPGTPPSYNSIINKIDNNSASRLLINVKPNVKLTEKQIQEFKTKYGEDDYTLIINKLSQWKKDNDYKYTSDAQAIRRWVGKIWLHNEKSKKVANSTMITSVKKEIDKNTKRLLLKELAETICSNSNDPFVVDGIKLLDHCYFDNSKSLSIKYSEDLKEIISIIEKNYNKPYLKEFISKLRRLNETTNN